MQRLVLGVLIGLGLGSAVSVDAQKQPEPCAHAWIVWTHGWNNTLTRPLSLWEPANAFTAKTECDLWERRANEKYLKTATPEKGFSVACYPDTFDPRGKQ